MKVVGHVQIVSVIGGGTSPLVEVVVAVLHRVHSSEVSESVLDSGTVSYELDGAELLIAELDRELELDVRSELSGGVVLEAEDVLPVT